MILMELVILKLDKHVFPSTLLIMYKNQPFESNASEHKLDEIIIKYEIITNIQCDIEQ